MYKRIALITISTLLLVFSDWLIKRLVMANGYDYVINPGISLSFFNGSAVVGLVLNLVGLGLAAYLTKPIYSRNLPAADLGLSFIWAGGIANLIDRLVYGGAVDYLRFFNISVFNFADILITLAFIIFIYQFLIKPHANI